MSTSLRQKVNKAASELKLAKRQRRIETIRCYADAGFSAPAIADILQINVITLRTFAYNHNIFFKNRKPMTKEKLSEGLIQERKYLTQQVLYWERERWRSDADKNATNNYYLAKKDLKDFYARCRTAGIKI
tara:strand:- start:4675 stop:5067 length:393 start_codon:yes stop_codon:yes gene_type:complete